MVNEATGGLQRRSGYVLRRAEHRNVHRDSVANQQGFSLRFPTINSALQSPGPNPAPQSRNANSLLIEDTLTWLKGSHNISMGGSFTQYDIWALNSIMVPSVNFDILSSDPANGLFTNANFPGASQHQPAGARSGSTTC